MKKKSFIKFLHETNAVEVDGNLYQAEKAFVVNRLMTMMKEGNLSENEQIKILTLINKYVNNELSIFFQGNSLMVELNNEEEEDANDVLAGSV